MLTLSIQQPWAWAICNLHILYPDKPPKDIENRDWYTSVRGTILVHTGKKMDRAGFEHIEDISGYRPPHGLPTGGIVGQTEIVACVSQSESPWFFGKYGFVLRNSIPLPFMPYPGRLGFFNVDYMRRIP